MDATNEGVWFMAIEGVKISCSVKKYVEGNTTPTKLTPIF